MTRVPQIQGVPKIIKIIDEVKEITRLRAKVALERGKYIRYIETYFRD